MEKITCLALLLSIVLSVSVISADDCGCGGDTPGGGSDTSSGYGSSEDPVVHLVKARELLSQGEPAGALVACRESLALDPNNVQALLLEGEILFQMGKYREAAAVYQEVTKISPSDEGAYTRLGNAYFLLGEYEAAGKAYTRSLALRPGDPVVEENLEKVRRLAEQEDHAPVGEADVPETTMALAPGIPVASPASTERTRIPNDSSTPTQGPAIALSPALVPVAFLTVTVTRRAAKIEPAASVPAR